MKDVLRLLGVGLLVSVWLALPPVAWADSEPVPAPHLVIDELNITGDEFVMLTNVGDAPANLGNYWLGYVGDDDATAAPSQALPDDQLPAGQALLLSNGVAPVCGATLADDLSFSLGNSKGTMALWQLSGSGAQVAFGLLDSVSWGKSADGPSYLHISDEANVAKYDATNPLPVWLRPADTSHNWQVGDLQNCTFTPVISPTTTGPDQPVAWEDAGSPPFVLADAVVLAGGSRPAIPAADIGLKALQLSEILPNPAKPATDADGEFIELYNPNARSFDLSGFILQTASASSSTTHTYRFPAGTFVAAKSFKAFFSSQTHLSLSNSGGQVWLVDPLGNTVTQSAAYGKADDGRAWINAGGKWQWTAAPTPGATNKLAAVLGSSSGKAATVKGKKLASVATTASLTPSGNAADNQPASVQPIHPLTLAAIAVLALLYAAYEYRHDIQNRLYQFRSYRAARRANRP